jgi:hypothetical protein
MKITPRLLRRIAAITVVVPGCAAFLAQAIIWLIPNCNPNPYALGECMVGSSNLAAPLLVVALGGFGLALLLFVFFAAPLLVVSFGLSIWQKQRETHGA